jgi:hypothetical protein
MGSAEARSGRLRYKQYTRVDYAQAFAQRLGIGTVDYGGRRDIANLANHAFFLAFEREAPLPQAVRVRLFTEEDGDSPDEIAYYLPGLGEGRGEIEINSGHIFWDDPAGTMRQASEDQEFSTSDPRHPVAHELGELAMHQSVGGDRVDHLNEAYLEAEKAFRGEDLAEVFAAVSDRATQNHSEFVAETFAALMLGRDDLRQNDQIMRLYEKYGGSEIRRYEGGS